MPRKGHAQTEESAKVKYTGFVRICLTVVAVTMLHRSGPRCFGEVPQRAGGPVLSSPALHRTHHFSVSSGKDSPTSSALGDLLETIHAKLLRAMALHGLVLDVPSQPLIWVCFDDREQFRRHSLGVEHAGTAFREAYYSSRTNQVVLCCDAMPAVQGIAGRPVAPDVSLQAAREPQCPVGSCYCQGSCAERILMFTHEMTHQLAYNSGLQKRGVMYPLWVSEGLATFFEGCALPQWDPIGNMARKRTLAKLHARGALLSLHELSVLAGPDALRCSPAEVYAQCWGLLGFLLTQHPDELSAYLGDLAVSPVGRRSSASLRRDFVRHFGSLGALEQDWLEYVGSRSSETGAGDRSVAAAADL